MKDILCLLPLICLLGAGCSNKSADDVEDSAKPKVAFLGKADDRFVATWKSTDGVSTYRFDKGGTYKLDSKIKVQQHAPIDSHQEGSWLVNGDRMLFKDGSGNVVPYAFALAGNTLELTLTGGLKVKTTLKRQ